MKARYILKSIKNDNQYYIVSQPFIHLAALEGWNKINDNVIKRFIELGYAREDVNAVVVGKDTFLNIIVTDLTRIKCDIENQNERVNIKKLIEDSNMVAAASKRKLAAIVEKFYGKENINNFEQDLEK